MKVKKSSEKQNLKWLEYKVNSETGEKMKDSEEVLEESCETIRIALRTLKGEDLNVIQNLSFISNTKYANAN